MRPGVAGRDVDPLGEVCADGDEDRVEAALVRARRRGPRLGGPQVIRTPIAVDPLELAVEHVAGQPVRRDAVPHHPARLGARVADLHLVAEPGQVVGGREPARPGADHEHPLAAAHRWHRRNATLARSARSPRKRSTEWIETALSRSGAVADALARVVADPPVDRRQRIVGDELAPRLLVSARLGVRQPRLDVLAGRAAGVARRQQVDVDGAALANRARAGTPVQQVGQRRHVPRWVVHAGRHGRTPMASRLTRLGRTPGCGARAASCGPRSRSPSRPCARSTASAFTFASICANGPPHVLAMASRACAKPIRNYACSRGGAQKGVEGSEFGHGWSRLCLAHRRPFSKITSTLNCS